MNCPICDSVLVERNGKFGPFTCCPKGNHGSFSVQGAQVYFTGAVGQMLLESRVQRTLALASIGNGLNCQPSFSQQLNAQMAAWGWNSSDEMSQLAEFAVGKPGELSTSIENDPDHWSNQRPF